ncbi:hypothetical protein Pint_25662 [Pistacia integerrima]|uniref:Uncharacterized protein n=2 Tax=Pistacia TaxID=55512 RepID=A0ACC1AZQ3_9ROSI|nr:hypothetical protein Pint_25662 [Pistacia integerrima]KAJ0092116.1 hypothetical protein Patl1_26236 [Pistacia atlantica]
MNSGTCIKTTFINDYYKATSGSVSMVQYQRIIS